MVQNIFGFVQMVLSRKQGHTLEKLSLGNQVLATLGQVYSSYCLSSWIITGESSLSSWPLSICIFGLSPSSHSDTSKPRMVEDDFSA